MIETIQLLADEQINMAKDVPYDEGELIAGGAVRYSGEYRDKDQKASDSSDRLQKGRREESFSSYERGLSVQSLMSLRSPSRMKPDFLRPKTNTASESVGLLVSL